MKQKLHYALILTIIFMGCSKSSNNPDPTPAEKIDMTTNLMFLIPYHQSAGQDTSDNFISQYSFSNTSNNAAAGAIYTKSTTAELYYVRYIPKISMLDTAYTDRNGTDFEFRVPAALKGKPLFEIYNKKTNTLYKRIIASSDSVRIDCSYSIFDNYGIKMKAVKSAFDYYTLTKQNDNIPYKVN